MGDSTAQDKAVDMLWNIEMTFDIKLHVSKLRMGEFEISTLFGKDTIGCEDGGCFDCHSLYSDFFPKLTDYIYKTFIP